MTALLAVTAWVAIVLLIGRALGINHLDADPMTTPRIEPQPANRRTNALMREHVELVAWCREVGHITTRHAGEMLDRAGVPFEVACRVLRRRVA